MSTNRKRRKRQLRRQIKQRERETIVLARKVAKRLLENSGWVTLPSIGTYPVEISEPEWYTSDRRINGKA